MSKYVIKQAYKPNAEMHPFAVHLCVSSLLLMLRNEEVLFRPPDLGVGGCSSPAQKGYPDVALGWTRAAAPTLATFD